MKNMVFLLLSLLTLLLALSCDQDGDINPDPSDRENFITFTIRGVVKKPVVYSVPASDPENKVDELDIYMFNESNHLLEKIVRAENADLGQSGTDLTVTIDVTGRTGGRVFYFVANGREDVSELTNATIGVTSEDDFKECLTNLQTGFIQTPLLMTARREVARVEAPADAEKRIELIRRVARFDLDNNKLLTNFHISKVFVETVNQRGIVFSNGADVPGRTIETGNLPVINYSDSVNANTPVPVESLFYLYPTEAGEAKVMISFEGIFNGERRIYALKAPVAVEANKRYILKVKKVDMETLVFDIVIDDWGDGGIHGTEPVSDDMRIDYLVVYGGPGIEVTGRTYDITNNVAYGLLEVSMSTYYPLGSRVEKTFLVGNETDFPGFDIFSDPPEFKDNIEYIQRHLIYMPPYPQEDLHIQIEVINLKNTAQRDTYNIVSYSYYGDTNLKPVVLGGLRWAPVNVGATEIGTTTGVIHNGLYFQWGRNTGFVYGGEPGDVYPTSGPFSLYDATVGAAKDKFIKSIYGDWITPPTNNLWSGDNQQGPCPAGWRVPTKAELEIITNAFGGTYAGNERVSWDSVHNRVVIRGDNGTDLLYFPTTGFRFNNGDSMSQGVTGTYWSSSPEGWNSTALGISDSGISLFDRIRVFGCAVRCVK